MANGLLRHDDPRLGLALEPIEPGDAGATLIISVLENLLRYRQFGVLAAPAAGFSKRLLVIKSHSGVLPVFDPVLHSAKDPVVVSDERNLLTGDLIRAACRANAVTVAGTGPDNAPITINLVGPVAHEAQQAFDLLAGQVPLQWLSPYQRAVVQQAATPARLNAAFAGVLRDISAQTSTDEYTFDWPVLTLAPGARIDMRDPSNLSDPALQNVFDLTQMVHDPKAVVLDGDALIGLLPALATAWPATPLLFQDPGPAAHRFFDRMADPRIAARPADPVARYPLVIVDGRDRQPDARKLANMLTLPEGTAIILMSGQNEDLVQQLKKSFVEVHLAQNNGATFYIATRLELNLPKALTGLLRGRADIGRWRNGFVRLDKDGQQRPAPF